jgi:hypothetical protein
MAKEQGLALNPTKISGQCGRLLCCLGYEFESYCELRKGMPKCGKKVCWGNQEWEVIAQNVLARQVTLRQGDGTLRTLSMDEFEAGPPCTPAPAETVTPAPPKRIEGSGQRTRPTPSPEQAATPSPQPAPVPAPVVERDDNGGEDAAKPATKRRRRRRRRSGRPSPEQQGE